MLNLSELKRRVHKEGAPAAIIEKDYALSVALDAIANSELFEHSVFKGGTAIKKVYFKEARFSEDLDFTVLKLSKDKVLDSLGKILSEKTIEGISFQKPVRKDGSRIKSICKIYRAVVTRPEDTIRLQFQE